MLNQCHFSPDVNVNAISPVTRGTSLNVVHAPVSSKDHKINLCLLNVCGLKSKLLSPDFEVFLSGFDIVALSETKLSDLDNVDDMFSEFYVLYKNRQSSKRASGGVALLVKSSISMHVHIHEPSNIKVENNITADFIMWVKIEKKFKLDILLGITYIPPEGSPYSSMDMFHLLENQLITLADMSLPFLLMGDFNARTRNLDDMLNIHSLIAVVYEIFMALF